MPGGAKALWLHIVVMLSAGSPTRSRPYPPLPASHSGNDHHVQVYFALEWHIDGPPAPFPDAGNG